MEKNIAQVIAQETGINLKQINSTIGLLDNDNTIPFIARYRKEITGGLNEVDIRKIAELLKLYRHLNERKEEVIRLINEQGKLTPELKEEILNASNITRVEDLYLPYRPKKTTKATIAREKGLEPLAEFIKQGKGNLENELLKYINEEITSIKEAMQGGLDIIAEDISDNAKLRGYIRDYVQRFGVIVCKAKNYEAISPYSMYYDYSEEVNKIPAHRILAINRAEREGYIKVDIKIDTEPLVNKIEQVFVEDGSDMFGYFSKVASDSLKRLILPSIERDIRNILTEKAESQAIYVFANNLRNLLLQPPIKSKKILGIDPAYRTGCKWAIIDETGKMLEVGVVYPTPPQSKIKEAEKELERVIREYEVSIICIGNGTASRETEQFIASLIRKLDDLSLAYMIVNEAGASVYSASPVAAKEFPDLDVSFRSAISIARRLQDPLAELVKIEPQSIGVGQYQHDINTKVLTEKLSAIVESVVNYVGVDLNTASVELLSYVAGINSNVAQNIVNYRSSVGKFKNRNELLNVKRLGAKTFEQCAGFLRITDGDNPLDKTAIHPESYHIAEKILNLTGIGLDSLGSPKINEHLKGLKLTQLANDLEVGLPTLKDVIDNLVKPGRDPREDLPLPVFRHDILTIEDLKVGMELKGTILNVVDFGAFVDIGLKQSGLVHISELSDRYVKHPLDVVSVGDIVNVKVLSVDREKERISLTMKF